MKAISKKAKENMFNGINAKCKQCAKQCKQFKQNIVIKCNFVSKVSNRKTTVASKHKKND